MTRRNLQREARHLMPRPVTKGWDDRARAAMRLDIALCQAVARDPLLVTGSDEARRASVRFIFDEMVSKARIHWIGGVPTRADIGAIERRVGSLLGLSAEQVTEALTGHPRPATVG